MLIITGALGGCVSVTTLEGERIAMASDEFPAYVEEVFRRQNAVASNLAFAMELESQDSARYRALESAELDLLDACAGLNDLANERRNGGTPRGLSAARRVRGAADCERAAARAEQVLAAREPSP